MYVCMYIYIYMYVCIYIYLCVCACVQIGSWVGSYAYMVIACFFVGSYADTYLRRRVFVCLLSCPVFVLLVYGMLIYLCICVSISVYV